MLAAEIAIGLPGDMLTKVDRMSMAHGLEVRSPFLDHRVAACAARMPPKRAACLASRCSRNQLACWPSCTN